MLAKLTHDHFSSEEWIYEQKLDGVRCLTFRKEKDVNLLSRNRKQQSQRYPELAAAIGDQAVDDFIVDGQIVAFDWQELGQANPRKYTVQNIFHRMSKKIDPWKDIARHAASVSRARTELERRNAVNSAP